MKEHLTKKEIKAQKHQEKIEAQQRKAHNKKILIYSICGVLALALIGFYVSSSKQPEKKPKSSLSKVLTVTESDWIKGNKNAKVTLLEFGDFQCPACATSYTFLKQMENEWGNNLRIVFRHFPLQSHSNAYPAAQAAEAAGKQGKFWQMHDYIYETQAQWSNKQNATEDFYTYARFLNIDLDKFKKDFASQKINEKIKSQAQEGTDIGVDSTPTFYLNGQKINPQSAEDFKTIVNKVIKESK